MLVNTEDVAGGVRVLTLARPPANAIDRALLDALRDAVHAASRDDRVRAIVVRGGDRFFSAGLDLVAMAGGEGAKMAAFGNDDGVFALWTIGKPTVAEVAGHAIAGGALIALACDYRIAADGEQKIGLNETAIGLAFPRGAFEIARATLPVEKLGHVLLGGELFGVAEARALGFVHEVVERAQLHDRCLELARKLGAYPQAAYAYNKHLIQAPYLDKVLNETAAAREALTKVWSSEETMLAFAKRLASVQKKSG